MGLLSYFRVTPSVARTATALPAASPREKVSLHDRHRHGRDTPAPDSTSTRRLVIVDEAPGKASFSWWLSAQIRAEVADMVCDPQCVTAPDEQVPYSPHGLAPGAIPQPADIVEAVRRAVTGHHEVDPTLKPVPAPGVTS